MLSLEVRHVQSDGRSQRVVLDCNAKWVLFLAPKLLVTHHSLLFFRIVTRH